MSAKKLDQYKEVVGEESISQLYQMAEGWPSISTMRAQALI